jgi:hypothetical protein
MPLSFGSDEEVVVVVEEGEDAEEGEDEETREDEERDVVEEVELDEVLEVVAKLMIWEIVGGLQQSRHREQVENKKKISGKQRSTMIVPLPSCE